MSVKIGEHESIPLSLRPQRLEITRLARSGVVNALEIELASTLYNLLGPVNISRALLDDPGVSPEEAEDRIRQDQRLWQNRPNLVPFGLMGGASIDLFDPDAPPPGRSQRGNGRDA